MGASRRVWRAIGTLTLVASLGTSVGCGDEAGHADDGGDGDGDGHDEDGAVEEGAEGTPTGSTCPSDNDLTYESFGQEFMDSYCTRCHSSELSGPDRNGAPADHDFDTLLGILSVAEHIDELAAAGPDAVNMVMPPEGDKPSEAERRQLGQWLACETEGLEGVDGGN